jgi:hypothetical protein
MEFNFRLIERFIWFHTVKKKEARYTQPPDSHLEN